MKSTKAEHKDKPGQVRVRPNAPPDPNRWLELVAVRPDLSASCEAWLKAKAEVARMQVEGAVGRGDMNEAQKALGRCDGFEQVYRALADAAQRLLVP